MVAFNIMAGLMQITTDAVASVVHEQVNRALAVTQPLLEQGYSRLSEQIGNEYLDVDVVSLPQLGGHSVQSCLIARHENEVVTTARKLAGELGPDSGGRTSDEGEGHGFTLLGIRIRSRLTAMVTSARVDAWVWAIRLYPTRSAATAACKAGHVKVNGVSAKPAQTVRVGDRVRALTAGGERIVVVIGLISKRTSATLAAQHFDDETPPPPPREERAARVVRERGAGRPTKRDRRLIERLRGRAD